MSKLRKLFGSPRNEETVQDNTSEVPQEDIEREDVQETPLDDALEDVTPAHEIENEGKINIQTVLDNDFIRLEATYRNQPRVMRRSTNENRITLGEVLDELFETSEEEIRSLTVIERNTFSYDIETKRIEIAEKILNFDLFGCILKKKIDGHYTLGMSNEATLIVGCKGRNIYVNISSLGGGGTNYSNKYIRVTVCLPDDCERDNLQTISQKDNWPIVDSLVLSFVEGDYAESLTFYERIEKSAMQKENAGERCDDIEDAFFRGKFQFAGYQYVGYGRMLYEQSRYYDAIITLKRAYKFMRPTIYRQKDEVQEVFRDICMMLGDCFTQLNRLEEAAFYYQPAIYFSKENGVPAFVKYVNTLAKLGDIRAYELAYNQVREMCVPRYGDTEDDWPQEIKQFKYDVASELYQSRMAFSKQLEQGSSVDGTMTIGELLEMVMDIDRCNILPHLSVYDNRNNCIEETVDGKDAICDYVINNQSSQDKSFVLAVSHSHNYTNNGDASAICWISTLIIVTHRVNEEDGCNLMRVDIMRANCPNNDDLQDPEMKNWPVHTSLIMGVAPEETFDTSDWINYVRCAGCASGLMETCRPAEAAKYLKWAFKNVQHLLKNDLGLYEDKGPEHNVLKWYYYIAYHLGTCLLRLEQFEKADYYLDIGRTAGFVEAHQAYINNVVNSKSPLALNIVETAESAIAHAPTPDNPDEMEARRNYMAFIRRRKVFVLINMQEFDEAKALLKGMTYDPLCRDFALSELKYLEQQEQQ